VSRRLLLPLLLLLPLPAWAHDVIHQVTQGQATVVAVGFADGNPLDFSAFELYRGDETIPFAVGRTDAAGRVVFIPDQPGPWRVKVWSDDGHGGDFKLTVASPNTPSTPAPTTVTPAPRWQILITGISWIFGIFGLLTLLRRRSPP